MKVISVRANENGVVRVFALSMDDAEARALKSNGKPLASDSPLAKALGCTDLDAAYVEVFPVSDLEGMALAVYLTEGAGVEPAALEQHRTKLAALDGWVLVVYSGAFGGTAMDLSPDTNLTLIGSYPQVGVNWQGSVDLSTPSALPQTGAQTGAQQPKKRPSDAAMSGRIAMIALLVAFFVVGLMLWVGS